MVSSGAPIALALAIMSASTCVFLGSGAAGVLSAATRAATSTSALSSGRAASETCGPLTGTEW